MKRIPRAAGRGFTLIELLTVTAIIIIITSIVLANNTRFGGAIQLENLAYDIALSIRQAQVFGISGQRFGSTGFNGIFGMHFDISNPKTYILFADALGTPNAFYDNGELVQSTAINGGFYISGLCTTTGTTETCGQSQLDIVFKRPQPDAYIMTAPSGSGFPTQSQYPSGRIIVTSPRGDTRSIIFDQNGQIYVSTQ